MKELIALSLALFVAATPSSGAELDQTTTIPLDQIWGYNLPGIQDIAGIPFPENPQGVGNTFAMLSKQRDHHIEHIRSFLASKPPSEPAQPGFVFQEPLNSRILMALPSPMRKKNPFQRDAYSGDLTLVFFSHPLSYYARLRKVEREGNQITVHYQFEPHTTPESTVHFALIPLGELPPGEYRVTYKQIPIDDRYLEVGFEPVHPEAREIVCRDFSFVVKGGEEVPKRDPSSEFIPLHEVWGYDMPGTKEVSSLDAEKIEMATVNPIINSLTVTIFKKFQRDDKAGPAFVVEGTGKAALEQMVAAFEKEPPKHIPADTPLSLVFYSRFSGFDVHITAIDKIDRRFIVTYQLVDRLTTNMTFNFALIPLGELPPGQYEVAMKQAPMIDQVGRRIEMKRDLSWISCHGATFTVRGRSP